MGNRTDPASQQPFHTTYYWLSFDICTYIYIKYIQVIVHANTERKRNIYG